MNILIGLTYYRPHYSGLTIYTERLARAWAARGHNVTVLTSQFEKSLPREEMVDGVRVVRLPVAFRISKGVIMPSIPFRAWQEIRKADLVNLHVPQLDAAPIAMLARLMGRPVLLTYHCDLQLPGGLVNRLANFASDVANHIAARMAQRIVTNTMDYAEASPFLRQYIGKVHGIPPPVTLPKVQPAAVDALRARLGVKPGERVIGMVARLAAEKGAETLVRAMPAVLAEMPGARVLYAGQHKGVMGEEAYAAMLAPMIAELGDKWQFLGLIPDDDLAAFFQVCDVVVVPSSNSTESFGIVQVEAMTSGTPAIASDLPGMRQPVLTTGMGRTFASGDSAALAAALLDVLKNRDKYRGDVTAITQRFSPQTIAAEYEAVIAAMMTSRSGL
ncbi:MAG: glycosyltransferase family 1 protein [Anaerolineae bacterium]|nr:MAG: glycosyltransferase family 1 protein [Anaerolineae bacterium]